MLGPCGGVRGHDGREGGGWGEVRWDGEVGLWYYYIEAGIIYFSVVFI